MKRVEELTVQIKDPAASKDKKKDALKKLEILLDKSFPLIG